MLPLIEGNEKVGEVRDLADQDKLTTDYTERAVRFIESIKRNISFCIFLIQWYIYRLVYRKNSEEKANRECMVM